MKTLYHVQRINNSEISDFWGIVEKIKLAKNLANNHADKELIWEKLKTPDRGIQYYSKTSEGCYFIHRINITKK